MALARFAPRNKIRKTAVQLEIDFSSVRSYSHHIDVEYFRLLRFVLRPREAKDTKATAVI